jgi:hypothetical protein
MKKEIKEVKMLVNMLKQASQLEHSLLDCYLYTASTIKSMPEEFETLSNGKPNIRKAIQFEKARQWKQNILMVSHEEMLHLHYVQCLLRALDESPFFELPERDKETGDWLIKNWDIYTGGSAPNEGTKIPLGSLTEAQIKQFILFESTDSLQNNNPFGEEITQLFRKLYNFELDFHLESILFNVKDDVKRNDLKLKLLKIYTETLPSDEVLDSLIDKTIKETVDNDLKFVRFQSIGDFYMKGILPLYQQAFDKNQVKNSNLTFNDELLGPKAAEGFLPVGPVYRSKNYTDFSNANTQNSYKYFKNVESIIKEIVEEGEGFASFEKMAEEFLSKIVENGGTRKFIEALKFDKKNAKAKDYSTPKWLSDAQLVRFSHLYRFAMIYMDIEFEKELSSKVGVDFFASRKPLSIPSDNYALQKMIQEMPKQFNSCYMVMLLWLSRIYEVKHWMSDKDRRYAIEMLATWPLMSLAIRPFLELISFFPVDLKNLYRLEKSGMPSLPTEAIQLANYFTDTTRSEEINKQIDYLALRVLANVSDWANSQIEIIQENFNGNEAEMIITRLKGLSQLSEFEKQFPFRVHGGYSNQLPDLSYQNEFPNANEYSEDPSAIESETIFKDSLVLKLRFGGFGLVQLSTDPDPPTDESGCTGTHMLHPADGKKRLDRALVWQNLTPEKNILREPISKLPSLGVNLIDLSLEITNPAGATAGYVPLQIMQSVGAVQTSGVQQYLEVTGLNTLNQFSANEITQNGEPIKFNLLEKDGIRPLLYGENHLVSKDGEPIDPFILSVTDSLNNNLFEREIYNKGKSMKEMDPLQRLETARWPTGFDFNVADIPNWVQKALPQDYLQNVMNGPMNYLGQRATVLYNEIEDLIQNHTGKFDQETIDKIISFAERTNLITSPRGTTVGWLTVMLNYGHSLSGNLKSNEEDNILYKFIENTFNLKVSCIPSESNRQKSNSRWLLKYTQGVMDTDALSNLVYGELFIPLQIKENSKPFEITENWIFNAGMEEVLTDFTCKFDKPFWAVFDVDGKTRKIKLPDPPYKQIEITETLVSETSKGYIYSATGVPGISNYLGEYSVSTLENKQVKLELKLSYNYDKIENFLLMTSIVGGYIESVKNALLKQFSPR